LRVCLRLPAYSASAKVICFIGKLGEWNSGILPKSGSLFQTIPKVKIQPVAKVPKGRIITKFKGALKASPAQIAANVAMMAAVSAVGWVMSDDNTKLQKKVSDGNPIPVDQYGWIAGNYCTGQKFSSVTSLSDCAVKQYQSSLSADYAVKVDRIQGANTDYQVIYLGTTYKPNGSYSVSGTATAQRQGQCKPPASLYGDSCLAGGPSYSDLTATDYDALDPWINKQSAAWLSDLLKEVCNGSNNPAACYSEMKSGGSLTGPAVVQGPSSLSTQTYIKPDGSQGIRTTSTSTEFGISYGDNYFDVTPKTTTTKTEDGTPISTEVETDKTPLPEVPPDPAKPDESPEPQYSFQDTDFPEVEPFYKQQYPDGLKGVWNSKQKDFKDSAFLKFLSGFVPTFAGVCPSFGLDFNIASWAMFGHIDFMSLCWVFDFIKIIMMVTTVFTCRALIFGG
uniref:hypothetical protein n=1 Tax=Metapseudomonas otitidis TaxID=319939 RepID=UPI0013F611A0